MKNILKISAALLATAFSQTVFAAQADSLFVRAGVAWFEPVDDNGFDGEAGSIAAFGADFGRHTVELEVSRVEFGESAGPFSVDLEMVPVMVNYRYNFDITEKFSVGVGGGAGLVFADLEFNSPFGKASDDDNAWVVAGAVRAEYSISAAVSLGAGYRYAWIDELDLFGASLDDNDTHVIDVALAYRW